MSVSASIKIEFVQKYLGNFTLVNMLKVAKVVSNINILKNDFP